MAGENPGYLAWLRQQPCVLGHLNQCRGHIEAHHHTHGRGLGQKSSDRYAMPLCHRHHMDFHNARGHFRGATHADRTAFQDEHCNAHWAIYDRPVRKDVF